MEAEIIDRVVPKTKLHSYDKYFPYYCFCAMLKRQIAAISIVTQDTDYRGHGGVVV
jgi:hypothetical protein